MSWLPTILEACGLALLAVVVGVLAGPWWGVGLAAVGLLVFGVALDLGQRKDR